MEKIVVNRFKTYRTMRWYRSNYLWCNSNPYLKKYDIEVHDDVNTPCDVLAIPCPHLPGKEPFVHRDDGLFISKGHRGLMDYQDVPVICDSSLDYASIDHQLLTVIKHPQLRKFLPGVSFRNNVTQQRRSWGGEYYGIVAQELETYGRGTDPRPDRERFPSYVQGKIAKVNRPPTPPMSDRVAEYIQQNMKPLKDREIDCFFSGRVHYAPFSYNSINHPTRMRMHLEHVWPKLPGNNFFLGYGDFHGTRYKGKPIASFKYPYEYVDALLNSKIIVSPWGWSPWCVRDFEALLCGCIVIKPECSNLLTWPDIYNPKNQLMVWTDVWFKNLSDQINYCLNNLDEMQDRANYGADFMRDACYPLDKVYESWTSDLRQHLEDSMNQPAFSCSSYFPEVKEEA
jgi:hypothetical protein